MHIKLINRFNFDVKQAHQVRKNIKKKLSLLKHGDITLNFTTQAREKWDTDVLSRPNF